MKRLLLLAALSAMGMLMFSSMATAQDDLDCGDFGSQAEAQATFDADPSDPNGLDAEGDGLACEEYPYAGTEPLPEGSPPLPDGEVLPVTQYQSDPPVATPTEEPSATYSALPDTGGPSLLVPVAALLAGAGVLGYAVIRRK